jgi:hypothetical protein
MAVTSNLLPIRRSSRVNIGCPVRISGVLRSHAPFAEDTKFVTVSKYGAKLKTRIPLQAGMDVRVKPLYGKKSGVLKVVWVGRDDSLRAGEVGVECSAGIASIVGVYFPDAAELGKQPDQPGKKR